MKFIGIYYFSGTGNTELVADMVKEEFTARGYSVDMIKIEDVIKRELRLDFDKYDFVGIGSQVIGFGPPRLVYEFVKNLPGGNGKKVFIFRTSGGVVPQNYNASKPLIRVLKAKGYGIFHERLFSIASNWMVKFDDSVIKQLYEATRKKVGFMCGEVIEGKARELKAEGLKWNFIRMMIPVFSFGIKMTGMDLYADKSACSNCGLCVRTCPASNIYEKRGKIKFKFNCNGCMRCVYTCPKKAIKYRILKFFIIPGGYNIKKTLLQPDGIGTGNGYIPPFFQKYISDDTM